MMIFSHFFTEFTHSAHVDGGLTVCPLEAGDSAEQTRTVPAFTDFSLMLDKNLKLIQQIFFECPLCFWQYCKP